MRFWKSLLSRHKCRPVLLNLQTRWIELNGPESESKRNKAAEIYLEAKAFCETCGNVLEGYFSPMQLGYGPEGPIATKEIVSWSR